MALWNFYIGYLLALFIVLNKKLTSILTLCLVPIQNNFRDARDFLGRSISCLCLQEYSTHKTKHSVNISPPPQHTKYSFNQPFFDIVFSPMFLSPSAHENLLFSSSCRPLYTELQWQQAQRLLLHWIFPNLVQGRKTSFHYEQKLWGQPQVERIAYK